MSTIWPQNTHCYTAFMATVEQCVWRTRSWVSSRLETSSDLWRPAFYKNMSINDTLNPIIAGFLIHISTKEDILSTKYELATLPPTMTYPCCIVTRGLALSSAAVQVQHRQFVRPPSLQCCCDNLPPLPQASSSWLDLTRVHFWFLTCLWLDLTRLGWLEVGRVDLTKERVAL